MFDISMAGPVAGAALSFSMFFVGLLLSSNPVGASDLVEVPSQLFQGSLLLGLISRATLGYRYLILDILNSVHFESVLVISFYFYFSRSSVCHIFTTSLTSHNALIRAVQEETSHNDMLWDSYAYGPPLWIIHQLRYKCHLFYSNSCLYSF